MSNAQQNKTILIVANSSWNVVNFRMGLIRALQAEEFQVVAAAPLDIDPANIKALGCEVFEVKVRAQSLNPLRDLGFVLQLFLILRQTGAQTCLFFTAKPNIFGPPLHQ